MTHLFSLIISLSVLIVWAALDLPFRAFVAMMVFATTCWLGGMFWGGWMVLEKITP